MKCYLAVAEIFVNLLHCSDEFKKKLDDIKLSHKIMLDEMHLELNNAKTVVDNKADQLEKLKSRLMNCEITLSLVEEIIREIEEKITSWEKV